jgi:hypothetical protein
MDAEPIPSVLTAIEAGRGRRGWGSRQEWSRYRARILSAVHTGLPLVRVAGALGVSAQHLGLLVAEACDAVLRGGAASGEAEAVCGARWQRWCAHGDDAACVRLRRGGIEPAEGVP